MVAQEVTMQHKPDRDAFFEALKLWDRPESELQRARVLPADLDLDETVEAAFQKALGNPSILPL